MTQLSEIDRKMFDVAVAQAAEGLAEGGVPIGGALAVGEELLGAGRNRRMQWGSAIRHGETDALEQAGRLPATTYRQATMYTTLSPCHMCSGAILLYGIGRVVIGENQTFVGAEELLASHGVELVILDDQRCIDMMTQFIAEHPEEWNEDIGEP